MYILDTNVFTALGHFYPSRFPTIWTRIEELATNGHLRSVREVQREMETNCPFEHIEEWVQKHHNIFATPNEQEAGIVTEISKTEQYRGLVKRQSLLKGLPVADPFVIAAAKFYDAYAVTQESLKPGGARIPTICEKFGVKCIDLEKLLEHENLKY